LAVARRGANPRPSQTRLGFGGAGGTGAPLICVFSLLPLMNGREASSRGFRAKGFRPQRRGRSAHAPHISRFPAS
jgi:hypothetical protein